MNNRKQDGTHTTTPTLGSLCHSWCVFSSGWEAEGYMCYALISYDAWILFYLFPGCMCAGTIGMILWRGG